MIGVGMPDETQTCTGAGERRGTGRARDCRVRQDRHRHCRADPNATVTVTTTLSDEPTASLPTTTTTQPPQTTAIHPVAPMRSGSPTVAIPAQPADTGRVVRLQRAQPQHQLLRRVGVHLRDPRRSDPIPVDSRCGLYDGDAEIPVRIVGWFNYDKAPCSTILQGQWREPGAVLGIQRGRAILGPRAEFACYSTLEALYCTGPQNYGFKLSRTEFARYQLS